MSNVYFNEEKDVKFHKIKKTEKKFDFYSIFEKIGINNRKTSNVILFLIIILFFFVSVIIILGTYNLRFSGSNIKSKEEIIQDLKYDPLYYELNEDERQQLIDGINNIPK